MKHALFALVAILSILSALIGCQRKPDLIITIVVPNDAAGIIRIREDGKRGVKPTYKKDAVTYTVDGDLLLTTDTKSFEQWHTLKGYRRDGSKVATIHDEELSETDVVLRCIGTVENDVVFHIGTFAEYSEARDRVLQNRE